MADVCDDDGVSGASLRRKGAAKLLFFFYTRSCADQPNPEKFQPKPIATTHLVKSIFLVSHRVL